MNIFLIFRNWGFSFYFISFFAERPPIRWSWIRMKMFAFSCGLAKTNIYCTEILIKMQSNKKQQPVYNTSTRRQNFWNNFRCFPSCITFIVMAVILWDIILNDIASTWHYSVHCCKIIVHALFYRRCLCSNFKQQSLIINNNFVLHINIFNRTMLNAKIDYLLV